MSLVADALDQVQRGRIGRRHDRRGTSGKKESLKSRLAGDSLRNSDRQDTGHLQFREHVDGLPELSPSAVYQQQIREHRILALQPRVPALERIAHRSIVVARLGARDVETAIVRLPRAVVLEDDTGGDRRFAAGVAHVEALDPPWRFVESEQFLQRVELPAQVRAAGDALLQRELGVVHRHRYPSGSVATHVASNRNPPAGLLAERLLQHLGSLRRVAEQDLVGDRTFAARARQVVLGKEGTQQLVLAGVAAVRRLQRARTEVLSVADDEQLDHRDAFACACRDDIHVSPDAGDVLPGLHPPQICNLIAVTRGELEFQRPRCRFHAVHQLVDHLLALALEKHDGVTHVFAVCRLVDQADTWSGAALDLVLQTGPGAVLEERVLALADTKQLLKLTERATGRPCARERTEVAAAPALRSAMEAQAREPVFGGDVDVGKALVVAKQDVVTGAVLLDQIVLEQERFRLRVRRRHFDRVRMGHQRAGLRFELLGRPEIARDTPLQAACLSDIEDPSEPVEQAIHARIVGQGSKEGPSVESGRMLFHGRRGVRAPPYCTVRPPGAKFAPVVSAAPLRTTRRRSTRSRAARAVRADTTDG